ncbi:MAG: ABC transporter permease, partial [Methylomonas sp.]|nr:ABC transporter permease [Methylomonas sp.]
MSNKLIKFFNITGLTWFVPLVRIAVGENPVQQLRQLGLVMGVPVIAFVLFLGLWSITAARINTSLGAIPGPVA